MKIYDWISVVLVILAVIFSTLSSALAGNMKPDTNDKILNFYIKVMNKYIRSSIWFLGFFYWLTLYSIWATIIVIYLSSYSMAEPYSTQRIFLYSVISLFCTIVNLVINPRDISTTFRASFIMFDKVVIDARDKYENDPEWGKTKDRYASLYEIDHKTEMMLKCVIK